MATVLLILKGMDLLAAGIEWLAEDRERYDRYRSKVEELIREGREPTQEEFDALIAEGDSLTEQIKAATEAKRQS